MSYLVVGITALLASGLTFFSGFGLNTILLPAMAVFFPVETAVAMTAVVHMTNNAFKLTLVGRKVNVRVALKFGLPAIITAYLGARLLSLLSRMLPIASYHLWQNEFSITAINLVVGAVMVVFSLVELLPRFQKLEIDEKWLPLGGIISGFFGGLSGHQGAARSVFLSKSKLEKESFIATGIIISFMVDITRISVYAGDISSMGLNASWTLAAAAALSAFAGSFIGSRFIEKVTLKSIQVLLGIMLIVLGVLVALGLV